MIVNIFELLIQNLKRDVCEKLNIKFILIYFSYIVKQAIFAYENDTRICSYMEPTSTKQCG